MKINKLNCNSNIKIIGSYLSPYVRKVLICLEYYKINYQIDPINPFLGNEKFLKLSPLRRIPIYIEEEIEEKEEGRGGNEDKGIGINEEERKKLFILNDSTVICEYLHDKYLYNNNFNNFNNFNNNNLNNTHFLYPIDIKNKAKARWIEEYCDTRLGEVFIWHYYKELFIKKVIWNEEPDYKRVKIAEEIEIPEILNNLEKQLPKDNFLFGDKPTVADISITSFFRNLTFVGYNVNEERWPITSSFNSRMLQLEPFQKLMKYENAIMTSTVADRRRILQELGAPLTSETYQTLKQPRRGIMDI